MKVKYVLFVIYCAVHMADCHEYCASDGLKHGYAFCTTRHTRLRFDFVPRIDQRLTYIDLNGQPLKQLPRHAFQNITITHAVKKIYIGNCEIQHIDADAFLNLVGLKNLYLQNNNITHFETGTFQRTKQLEQLVVDYNMIEYLQTGLFHNLTHLKAVTLQHNRIACIGQDTFRNTPSLAYIDLGYNELQYLSPLFTDNFVNITRMLVNDNPWNCDCNLKKFYKKNQERIPTYTEPTAMCENPPGLRGRNWTDLTSDAFKCNAGMILQTTVTCTMQSSTDEDNE